jgi:hypothetical protein
MAVPDSLRTVNWKGAEQVLLSLTAMKERLLVLEPPVPERVRPIWLVDGEPVWGILEGVARTSKVGLAPDVNFTTENVPM